MPTLASNPGPTLPAGPPWMPCDDCGQLFPAAPEQTRCRYCEPRDKIRCAAAHPDDSSPCDGPPDAVRVMDRAGAPATGCIHHAAMMLASITGARVYPGSINGAAIAAYNRAAGMTPFAFHRSGRGRS